MSTEDEASSLALLASIAAAARGGEGPRCLRLMEMESSGFAALREEALRLCDEAVPSRVDDERHVTHWTRPRGEVTQYSLFNRSGRFDDYAEDHDRSRAGKHFGHADRYRALGAFIAAFPEAVNFRVNVLGRGARLSPHQEAPLFALGDGRWGVCARFHLPIETTPGAELLLEGEVRHLEEGAIFFVNHGCVHAARNLDARRRAHLVWDMPLTRAAVTRMFGGGPVPVDLRRCTGDACTVPVLRQERMGAVLRLPAAWVGGSLTPTFCPDV